MPPSPRNNAPLPSWRRQGRRTVFSSAYGPLAVNPMSLWTWSTHEAPLLEL